MTYKEIFEEYKKNASALDEIEELVKDASDKEVWLTNMRKRSMRLEELYESNNKLIALANELNSAPIKDEEEELYVYNTAFDYYVEFYDTQILAPMYLRLIRYYESINNPDLNRLLAAYFIYSANINEVDVRNNRSKLFIEYYKKIITYKDQILNMNRVGKNVLLCAYHSLISVSLETGSVPYHDMVMYLDELMRLVTNEENKEAIKQDNLTTKLNIFLEKCLSIYSIVNRLDDNDVKILEEYLEFVKSIDDISRHAILEASLYLRVRKGDINYYEASKELLASFKEAMNEFLNIRNIYDKKERMKDKENAIWLEFMNTPFVYEDFTSRITDRDLSKFMFNKMDDLVGAFWGDSKTTDFVNVYPQLITMWLNSKLKYIDDKKELEKCIFNGLLKKQIPTYIHSVMVKDIALAIYDEMPEVFSDIPVADIRKYIHDAALFHDIGKLSITNIVNTQDRKLSDNEFIGIKSHPELGLEVIENTTLLDSIKDVIHYHHKFYDGTKGYPNDDGNIKSMYRLVIDLVTISDCIDAATDYLGRKYKVAKRLDDVYSELLSESGTRYNPILVQNIVKSESLKQKLKVITEHNREELMYEAYKSGIENN